MSSNLAGCAIFGLAFTLSSPPRLTSDHRRAIALLSVAAAASAASARMCDPMLPEIARSFSTSPGDTALVVSGFMVAYGLAQALFGPSGDRFGKVRVIAFTCLASTVGTLGAALAGGLSQLVAARVLMGLAAAGIIPLSMAWIGDTVGYQQRQATLARFLTGQIAGIIGGQFVGGLFTDMLGWRWAFAFVCAIYLAIGVALLAECGKNPVIRAFPPSASGQSAFLAQLAMVLRTGWARVVIAIVFLEGAAVFGPLAFVPSHLHGRFGLDLTTAGALMGLFGIGGLSYILFAPFLVRRLGEVGLSLVGGLLIAAAWAIIAFAGGWQWALPASYLAGLGYYMLHNTLQTNATQMVHQARGTAVALFASSFFLGQSLGVALAAALLARLGAVAVYGSAALTLPLVGALFSALLRRRAQQQAETAG